MGRVLLTAPWVAIALTLSSPVRAQDTTLTFAKALESARQRAPEIAAARAALRGAEADVSTARAAHLPTLTASATGQALASRNLDVIVPTQQATQSTTYTRAVTGAAALRWTLYDFGKTANQVAAALDNQRAAEQAIESAVVAVALDVGTAYVTAAYRDELRETALLTVTQRERLVALARGLVRSGLQPPVEELRATARLEAARRDLVAAETEAMDASAALATLVGVAGHLKVSRPSLPVPPAGVERAAARAAKARETIREACARLDAKSASMDAARSRWLPTLALTGDASWRFAKQDVALYPSEARTVIGGLVLSVPVFDGTIGAQVASADADVAAAGAELELARRDARKEATRAAIAVQGAESSALHAKKVEDLATSVFALVRARYAQGLASPTELIEAESFDAEARAARINAEMTQALGVVRLLVAVGDSKRMFEEPTR